MEKKEKKNKKKWFKIIIILILFSVIMVAVMAWRKLKAAEVAVAAVTQNTATVERRSISSELSSSGTLEAKDTYSITPVVEGEVLAADFEEGDQVEKNQVLYEVDKAGIESELASAVNSLSRAQKSFEDAKAEYEDILNDYSGGTYKSTYTGYVTELYIQEGSKISGNTQLADLYNDDIMEIRIPFLAGEAVLIGEGMPAVLTLTDTQEQLEGVVKAVASQNTVLTGGRIVRNVTICVANPGGLTTSMKAMAQIGEFVGSGEGIFEASIDTTIHADLATSVEVKAMLIHEGDYITNGTPLFSMTSNTADKLIQSYKDTLDRAEEDVESAQNKLESTQDQYDNYTITAPISGQIITKNYKVGDNITKNSSSATVLATIYDLSSLVFKMSIDELDIQNVKVGQKVSITADAFEDDIFTGTVTNVSLESSYSNGVSTYPVTVTVEEKGKLLPGMNVDGIIILDQAEEVLTIPVDALMRGNQVYLKDDTVTEQQGAVPAGFRAVMVETGLTSDMYVEIVSGLSEGDVVYVAKSTKNSSMMMPGGGMGGVGGNRGGAGGNMSGVGGNMSGVGGNMSGAGGRPGR